MRELKYAVAFLFAANMADTVLTDWGLRLGLVRELNPLMSLLYQKGVFWFYAVKLSLSFAMLYVVPKVGSARMVRPFYSAACVVYAGALALHTIWIARQI